eukprot:1877112-Amphidinium_carterae.2
MANTIYRQPELEDPSVALARKPFRDQMKARPGKDWLTVSQKHILGFPNLCSGCSMSVAKYCKCCVCERIANNYSEVY